MAPNKPEKDKVPTVVDENPDNELLNLMKSMSTGIASLSEQIGSIDKRVKDIETGGKERFKAEANVEDIQAASEGRNLVDPRINEIVDEMLGTDFGREVKPLGDRPGFRFTLIVPHRLSDNVQDKRPSKDPKTGEYKRNAADEVIFEDYIPEDRRSRIISSTDSYDSIQKHCERVRAYIVAYFQKTAKPLPEFRVK